MENPPTGQQNVNIKIEDSVLKGSYSNLMFASHNKEEFVLDFMSVFGPQGIQIAKIITSPEHFKRIVAALSDNLTKYEKQFGDIGQAEKLNQNTNANLAAPEPSRSSDWGFTG
jgi:hypothetical protein